MTVEERLDKLERDHAKLSGRNAAITSTLVLIISGEISPAMLEHRKERLIANTLGSYAPDEFFDGVSECFEPLIGAAKALAAHRNQQ